MGRYVLIALAVAVVALVIYRVTGRSRVETPSETGSPVNQVGTDSKVTKPANSSATEPTRLTKLKVENVMIATNGPLLRTNIPSQSESSLVVIPATESPPAGSAGNPALMKSPFGDKPVTATPLAPPPVELFRTNAPEEKPGQGRPYTGP